MTRRMRIAQIGCGGRAQAHLAAMLTHPDVEVVALCDRDEARLHATGERFGITQRYTDLAQAIAQSQPDLVDIVTPPEIRLSIIAAAIAAGAPAILIEKPLALTPSESRAIAKLGESHLIAVNTQYQWMPHWQEVWQILRTQQLGAIRSIRASTGVNILEQGPHVLDLAFTAIEAAGLPAPEWVLASCEGIEWFGQTPVPADTSAVMGIGDIRLFFNAGPSAPPVPGETNKYYQQQLEIIGERGRIWVSLNQGWHWWSDGAFRTGRTAWPDDDDVAQRALFGHLHQTLIGGTDWRQFPTHITHAYRRQQMMFACYASSQLRQRVSLTQEWGDEIIRQMHTH
jgi:predicted dehydrogenase